LHFFQASEKFKGPDATSLSIQDETGYVSPFRMLIHAYL